MRQAGLDCRLQVRRKGRSALDAGRVLGAIESYQPQKTREDGRTPPVTRSDDISHHLADAVFVQHLTFHAKAE